MSSRSETTMPTSTTTTEEEDILPSNVDDLNDSSLLVDDDDDDDLSCISSKVVVTFSHVVIREYPIILGGGPPTSGGPPITIDWEVLSEEVINLDMYEFCHPYQHRRHAKELIISPYHRTRLLFQCGTPMDEIADVTIECDKIKHQRMETMKHQGKLGGWERWNLAIESAGKTVQKLYNNTRPLKRNTIQARTA